MRHFDPPAIRTQPLIFNLFGDYVNPRGDSAWTSGLIDVLGVLNVSERAARSTLSRMKQKGWLISGREGRRSYYELTPKGKALLDEGTERLFGPRPSRWDGYWHLVAYSLPQGLRNRRDHLRTRLSWLGYGNLEPGLMVAPYPRTGAVIALVHELDIQPHVHFFTQARSELTDSLAIVARCWDLDALNARYAAFITRVRASYEALLERTQHGERLDPDESFVHRFWATYEFSAFPREDPYLPPELLPSEWLGVQASKLLTHFRSTLQKSADAFVREKLPIRASAPTGAPDRSLATAARPG